MPALFPNSVRIYSAKTDLIDTVLAEHVNLLQDEVTAIESVIGVLPLVSTWSGTYTNPSSHATIAARLLNIEAGLTSLGASKLSLSGGTMTGALAGTTANFTGAVSAQSFSGSGSALTGLNAGSLASGTVSTDRLTGTYSIGISGNAATASRWDTARTFSITGVVSGSASVDGSAAVTINTTNLSGSGANLTSLNASALSSGTVPSARLSGSYAIDISGTAATATSAPNSVSRTNGSVTTASVSQSVVRNITISTSDPTSGVGSEGDVWLKTLA